MDAPVEARVECSEERVSEEEIGIPGRGV